MTEREFTDITEDIDALLGDPVLAKEVAHARELLATADREYAMGLAALRQALGLTQVELAKRLEVSQGNIAQVEKRGDLLISTLASYLGALGGHARIVVEFSPGHAIEVDVNALAHDTVEGNLIPS